MDAELMVSPEKKL